MSFRLQDQVMDLYFDQFHFSGNIILISNMFQVIIHKTLYLYPLINQPTQQQFQESEFQLHVICLENQGEEWCRPILKSKYVVPITITQNLKPKQYPITVLIQFGMNFSILTSKILILPCLGKIRYLNQKIISFYNSVCNTQKMFDLLLLTNFQVRRIRRGYVW